MILTCGLPASRNPTFRPAHEPQDQNAYVALTDAASARKLLTEVTEWILNERKG